MQSITQSMNCNNWISAKSKVSPVNKVPSKVLDESWHCGPDWLCLAPVNYTVA